VLLTLLALAFILGPLIFVHEMGHFLAAKAVGIQVLRFSIGFGRPLLQWRRGETEYWVSWLPLGGYVKMAGLEDEGMAGSVEGGKTTVPVDPARAFDRQPLWKRIVVILAGVTMNAVLAVAVYSGLYGTVGTDRVATTQIDTVYTSELPKGAETLALMSRGDRIVAVDGDSVSSWEDLIERLVTSPLPLTLQVAGREAPVVVTLARGKPDARVALVQALEPLYPAIVRTVAEGDPAAQAGFRAGDRVVRVNGEPVVSWVQFARLVRGSPNRRLIVDVDRGGTIVSLTVTPALRSVPDPRSGEVAMRGFVGIAPVQPIARERFGPLGAVRAGVTRTGRDARQVLTFLKGLITRDVSLSEVGGPITIGRLSGQAARQGFVPLLALMAILSVNLALLNLLPIPILDGGQLMFLIAEGILRRPLSLGLRLRLTQFGFAVLATLMLLIIGREVLGLFRH